MKEEEIFGNIVSTHNTEHYSWGKGCDGWQIDGTVRVLQKHEGIEIPPGVPHQFRNESAKDVVFLVISMPSSHGDRDGTLP